MAGPRKISIYDYPEHLNPFREDDNHNKIRFWTIGRKLSRSNSITFKDIRNSWSLRSFMKKGKKEKSDGKSSIQQNGDNSPIVYRRALQYSTASTGARSTVSSPERADRYVYGGSVTPLPRSRFQERLRSPSQHEVNSINTTPRMARSDITGSRLSVESTNPFDEGPVPPVRASRRKKKRAPLPPQTIEVSAEPTMKEQTELRIAETDEQKVEDKKVDEEIEEVNLNIELKIVEDEDVKTEKVETSLVINPDISTKEIITSPTDAVIRKENEVDVSGEQHVEIKGNETTAVKNSDSEDDILKKVSFPKIDINKYRRNSSVNDDDIRLRRGNLEDFHSLSNKRSKSLTNAIDGSYVCYDENLNEDKTKVDVNSNEEPQKVVCKLYDDPRKKSVDHSLSSTENDFIEIDRATRELEREISKLNSALIEEDITLQGRQSVSDIRRKFDKPDVSSPNPIPKPRRSHYGDTQPPVNGTGVNLQQS
ncbi:unnamed protein product, partial [Iphiclides podalirius]